MEFKSNQQIRRREFLLRAAKAGIFAGAACSLGFLFHDQAGPGPFDSQKKTVILPDFSLPEKKKAMAVVHGLPDRKESLRKALEALGGIEEFIKKGDRVLLKVNAAFASPPSLSATTHPDLVSETTRLCFAAGAGSVVVTDNPINTPSTCFLLTGIEKAAIGQGADVVVPRESLFRPTTVKGAKLIRNWPLLFGPFKGINKLIGLAPVKDHHRSGASMTMKNWYGLLGGARNIFHQDIHGIISELAMMVSPTLVILDGTQTMMENGPTGGSLSDLKQTNIMIAGADQVAVDAFGAGLLNDARKIPPYIEKAAALGAGTSNFKSLNPILIQG
jgi:uncharacterized protein (DUF362 family)